MTKGYHEIIVTEGNLIETSEFIFKTLAKTRGEVGARKLKEDGLTLAELRQWLTNELKKAEGGGVTNELNLPNCKCTHPPSMGFCTFGFCSWGSLNISKDFSFSGYITITINF
jgi:hypothetical protein